MEKNKLYKDKYEALTLICEDFLCKRINQEIFVNRLYELDQVMMDTIKKKMKVVKIKKIIDKKLTEEQKAHRREYMREYRQKFT